MPRRRGASHLNGKRWTLSIPMGAPPPPPPPPAGPPALSDITITQPVAIPPFAPAGWWAVFAFAKPIGGIGPFNWTLGAADRSKYALDAVLGTFSIIGADVGTTTDSITAICKDARGATVQRAFTVMKTDGTADVIIAGAPNPQHNCTLNSGNGPLFQARGFFKDTPRLPNTVAVYLQGTTTISPKWSIPFDWLTATTTPPAVGSYPLTINWGSTALGRSVSRDYTIQIVQFTQPDYIEFISKTISSALPRGYMLGKACCTTPNNVPTWTMIDATSTLRINSTTGVVSIANPPVAGTLNYQIRVDDATASYTQSFSATVVAGTIYPSTNISMTLATNLTNYSHNPNNVVRPVGAPSVTGFPSGATLQWFLQDKRYNAEQNTNDPFWAPIIFSRGHGRYVADPATGSVTAQGYLSAVTAPTDYFDLTVTDGINSCTRRFAPTVRSVTGPTIHVGQGMSTSAPAGTTGYEHLYQAMAPFIGDWTSDYAAIAGATVYIHYNPDPNYYADDIPIKKIAGGHYDRGLNGPIKFIGIPDTVTGMFPRLGGTINSSMYEAADGKAFFTCDDGDFEFRNIELSFVVAGGFSGDYIPANGMSGIRWNSIASGSLLIDNCYVHDCDDLLKSGSTDGRITITNTLLTNGSQSTTGSGNNHNAYIGDCFDLIVDNVLSYNATPGHAFKTRSAYGTITNSRFYDGARGSESLQFDIPNAGVYTIDNCTFWKASHPQNGFSVDYGSELQGYDFWDDPLNPYVLTVSNSKFVCTASDALVGAGLAHYVYKKPSTGTYSTVYATNNTFYGFTAGKEWYTYPYFLSPGDTHDGSVIASGNVRGVGIPVLDFTPPTTYKGWARPGWYNAIAETVSHANFQNFNGRQVDPGVDQITVPKGSTAGTAVFTPTAYGTRNYSQSPNPQPDPNINPFIAGSVWGKTPNLNAYTGASLGLVQSKYNINASTGQVTVATVDATPGFDLFGISCTSPVSTGSRVVYYIAAICRV